MASKLGTDEEHRYIAHQMDHFTKFHIMIIWPTKTKEAAELAKGYKQDYKCQTSNVEFSLLCSQ